NGGRNFGWSGLKCWYFREGVARYTDHFESCTIALNRYPVVIFFLETDRSVRKESRNLKKFARLNANGSRCRDLLGIHIAADCDIEICACDSDGVLTDRFEKNV